MKGVVMFPDNHDLVHLYATELRKRGRPVRLVPSFHHATPLNLARLTILRIKGYRILHTHWLFFFPPVVASIVTGWAKLLGYRLIWEVHNLQPHSGSREVGGERRRKFFSRTDMVIYHSRENEKDGLVQLGHHDNVRIIPHPLFRVRTADRAGARERLGVGDADVLLLAFGGISTYKGYDDLVKSLASISDSKYRLHIAGPPSDPGLVARLEASAAKDARISLDAKHVSQGEMDSLFAAADIVVQPHREITTSGSVMLALSYAKPVVTTAIGCNIEFEGVRGVSLVQPSDPAGLSLAILAATARRDEVVEVPEHYRIDVVMDQWEAAYDSL